MSLRFLGSAAALAIVLAVVPLSVISGQAPAGKGKAAAAKTLRTPWGDPDLQGVWNDATSTPLQRPGNVGDKGVLSDEEAEEFQKSLEHDLTRDRRDGGNAAERRPRVPTEPHDSPPALAGVRATAPQAAESARQPDPRSETCAGRPN